MTTNIFLTQEQRSEWGRAKEVWEKFTTDRPPCQSHFLILSSSSYLILSYLPLIGLPANPIFLSYPHHHPLIGHPANPIFLSYPHHLILSYLILSSSLIAHPANPIFLSYSHHHPCMGCSGEV